MVHKLNNSLLKKTGLLVFVFKLFFHSLFNENVATGLMWLEVEVILFISLFSIIDHSELMTCDLILYCDLNILTYLI